MASEIIGEVVQQEKELSIEDISKVLEKTHPNSVKIHPTVFTVSLYENTILEGQTVQSQEIIFRKNIYFLAKKTVNVFDFINHLVQRGLLHLDDKSRIAKLKNEILQAMECYIVIVQQKPSKYEKLLHVLSITNNNEVLRILESNKSEEIKLNHLGQSQLTLKDQLPTTNPESSHESTQDIDMKETQEIPPEEMSQTWTCKLCTFINARGSETCEMCTMNMNVDPIGKADECPRCTLINPLETIICEVCGFRLKEEPEELLRDEVVEVEDA